MPKSRHRKLTSGQKKKGAMKRERIRGANRPKVEELMSRAFPNMQTYPPTLLALHNQKHETPNHLSYLRLGSRAIQFISHSKGAAANMRIGANSKVRRGTVDYESDVNGMLHAINKPRSRVKRLREARAGK